MRGPEDIHEMAKRLGITLPSAGEPNPELPRSRPGGTGRRPPQGLTGPPSLAEDSVSGRWQARLEAHFRQLHEARSREQAVFALEHGLTPPELTQLGALVRAEANRRTRERHWLLWAVHAAELGYDYFGDYWPRFATQTAGWVDSNDSRAWIRTVFHWFQERFGGPQPAGAWAEAFRLIAWPITNAILPRDLQRHLARALYEVQVGLVGHLHDAESLGRYVAANCWVRSDRFRQLTEQPRLLGQIALALLRPQAVGEETIHKATLDRIVSDLREERQSADWLTSARHTVETSRLRGRGRAFGVPAQSPQERLASAARATAPQIVLAPPGSASPALAVRLRLPFLTPLLEVSPETRAAVAGSRTAIPAAPTRRLATGQLLFPDQEIELERWPKPGEPLVKFEGLSEGLEAVLLTHWAMTGSPWLFRVRANATAAAVLSRRLHADATYIVAVTHGEPRDRLRALGAVPLEVRCQGVALYRLTLPEHLDPNLVDALREEGFAPAREVSIWPAGLLPVEWDGDSRMAWLSRDRPLIGIRADHHVANLQITLNEEVLARIEEVTDHDARYVAVSPGPGEYKLGIAYEAQGEIVSGSVSLEVREPQRSLGESVGPIIAWVDPYTRDLESLWEGRAAIRAEGVTFEDATCTFALGSSLSDRVQKVCRNIPLPLEKSTWRQLLQDSIKADPAVASRYEAARWGEVILQAEPFARAVLEFERELPPVRWRLSLEGEGYELELRDDTEAGSQREVRFASFNHPDQWATVSVADEFARFPADDDGGLYCAWVGERGATIVVPPKRRTMSSFSGLAIQPVLTPRPRRPSALAELVETTRQWSSARLGADARLDMWRGVIVRLLHNELFSLICGPGWAAAERDFQASCSPADYERLRALVIRSADDRLTIAGALIADPVDFGSRSYGERIDWFMGLARRTSQRLGGPWQVVAAQHPEGPAEWLAQFCLRAASDAHLDTWAGDSLEAGLNVLLEWPLLARTARCLVARSLVDSNNSGYPPMFPEWEWSLV